MRLFKISDISEKNNMKLTKNKEILLNQVANKGGWGNLTFSKICKDKRMFHIQTEAKVFLKNSKDLSMDTWMEWLNQKCNTVYELSLDDVCSILGKRLYYWLLNPSQQLPTPEQAKKYNRKGVDEDDIQIIKSSVEWYNITEGDCINWVHNLIVDRNYMGATAEQKVKEIIEKYLIEFRIKATVRLSSSVDDSEGKDLIIEQDKKRLAFQIKRNTYNKYQSIQESYDNSYDKEIMYIIYNDTPKFEICNLEDILNIIKNE
jgi:hypothetical protein